MNKQCEIVNLEYRVYQSFKGKYFIGHTPILKLTNGSNSWSGGSIITYLHSTDIQPIDAEIAFGWWEE